jgi:hypothetical protein
VPALLFAVALLAQELPPAGVDAQHLERIRKALEHPAAIETERVPNRDGAPVFRLTVKAWKFDVPAWHDDSLIPLYVRPTMPPTHFEFLEQVTPEFFRSSVLYPGFAHTPFGENFVGIPMVPIVEMLAKATKALNRKLTDEAAKEEVRQALERLLACRADPSKPSC